ncbi:MAG: hypothetical protein V8T86_13060 [Victivallis sp.]
MKSRRQASSSAVPKELSERIRFSGSSFFEFAAVRVGARRRIRRRSCRRYSNLSDNSFGTAEEDAWRRDFTVNALFYDPVELLVRGRGSTTSATGSFGRSATRKLRLEDPVRHAAPLHDGCGDRERVFSELELIRVAAPSRLALELEKILSSPMATSRFQAFHDYGLLQFISCRNAAWDTQQQGIMR